MKAYRNTSSSILESQKANNMGACILYARQSFGSETESTSIDVQLESCRKWAVAHGMQIAGEYSDYSISSEHYPLCEEGIEAARIDRGYQRWLKEQRTQGRKQYKQGLGEAFRRIAQGGVTHLLVYTRTRLGRTADGSYLDKFLTNYLLEHHVSLVTVQDGTVMDFSDDFMALVMSIKDTLSYKELREKAKASLASIDKRINSYKKWSNALGVVMRDGVVTFNPDYSELIRYAYTALVDGATYGTILHRLNTAYQHLAKGRQWYQTNVRAILRNPVYCGYMRNREGVLGRAVNIPEPVVSYSLWQKAQEIVEHKRINGQKHVGTHHHFLPLSGYLMCPCGRRLTLFVDRGKVAYHCVNGGTHRTAIYITDDVLRTIQSVFVISLVKSHRALVALRTASDKVDTLKADIVRLKASQVAKMSLVETDEDVVVYKPVIDAIKASIKAKQEELARLEGELSTDADEAQKRLEEDFHAIMEGELLPEDTYMRLMQECISNIAVHADHIDIITTAGVTIPVPRLEGKHHSRRLMRCTLICDTTDGTLDGLIHYQLHLYDREVAIVGGEKVIDSENMSVSIHWPENGNPSLVAKCGQEEKSFLDMSLTLVPTRSAYIDAYEITV